MEGIDYDPDEKIIRTKPLVNEHFDAGIGKIIYDSLKKYSKTDFVAQIQSETGQEDSFKDLYHRVVKLATYFQDIGIKQGDMVSLCTYSQLNTLVAILAAQIIGAITGSTDPRLSLDIQKDLLNVLKPKVIFVSKDSESLIEQAIRHPTKMIPFEKYKDYECFDDIMKKYDDVDPDKFLPYNSTDLSKNCLVCFSSGTCSSPKAVCFNQKQSLSIMQLDQDFEQVRYLAYGGSYWLTRNLFIIGTTIHGGCSVLMKSVSADTFWKYTEKYQVNIINLANMLVNDVARALTHQLPNVLIIIIMGGPVRPSSLELLKKKLPHTLIDHNYGMTEIGSITALQVHTNKPGCVGPPLLNGQWLKVVDPERGVPLGFNQVGELLVRPKDINKVFYNEPNEKYFDSEGFFRTGDLVYYDENFDLSVVGRTKDIFKSKGFQIMPTYIEAVLLEHPDVKQAVAFGIPHSTDESIPMALVVLKDDSKKSPELEQNILNFANEKLDCVHKLQAGVKIIDGGQVPFTPTDKIKRFKLRDLYLNGQIKF